MEMNTGIYEILNTKTGQWYRGQTQVSFKDRWKGHRALLNNSKHTNEHLQSAWNKYGSDVFTFRVLARCAPEFCNEMEDYWIGEDYNRPDISYNKMAGGGSVGIPSEETKIKISEAKRGKTLSDEHKQKISAWSKQQKHTKERRQKQSEKLKGRKLSEEWKIKLSEAAKNRPKTPCLHCGKKIDPSNMIRWHGDNCKYAK